MLYLKIENPGVAPPESFTLLGATTKGSSNQYSIGKFGSGGKFGVIVLMRAGLKPVIFCDKLCLEFDTRKRRIDDGLNAKTHDQVVVKYSGKTDDGRTKSSTEDLGFTLTYGAEDWTDTAFGLREFVSNAIDRAVEEGRDKWFHAYCDREIATRSLDMTDKDAYKAFSDEANDKLREYDKTATDYNDVVIEVVNENQVRAKAGTTRVFVPMNEDVFTFHKDLGKWFLHFSEPELLNTPILSKNNRNLDPRRITAVVYRRGVRVREFATDDTPSLFDYNLNDLQLDESRNVEDYYIKHYAGVALGRAQSTVLRTFLASFYGGHKYWEHCFEGSVLERAVDNEINWRIAGEQVFGDRVVIASESDERTAEVAKKKGFEIVKVPDTIYRAARTRGVRTAHAVLTADELAGQEILPVSEAGQAAVDKVWTSLESIKFTGGKPKPEVKLYRDIMRGENLVTGFYRDNTIFLLESAVSSDPSQDLLQTILEECGHYITGATDQSRDFQDWAFGAAIRFAMKGT